MKDNSPEGSEKRMESELKNSAKRHAHRLITKIKEVIDVPGVVQDSIRREMEYATKDGYRITMQNINRNGDTANERPEINGNR